MYTTFSEPLDANHLSSSIGGEKVEEKPTDEYDGLIKQLEDKIRKTNEAIQQKKQLNYGIGQINSTADMHLQTNYKIIFMMESINWLDKKTLEKLRDPSLSQTDKVKWASYAQFSVDSIEWLKKSFGSSDQAQSLQHDSPHPPSSLTP